MTDFLFGKGTPSPKRAYFWNLCCSFLYSVQSAILLLVITRTGGLYAAGVFSIVYTVPQMLMPIASFSMRNFQVSDARNEFSFSTYFSSRILTSSVMILAVCVYALAEGMQGETFAGAMLFALYRAAESMEDVFCGAVEKRRRLDVVAMAQSLRMAAATLCFCVVYLVFKNLLLAEAALLLSTFFLMVWMDTGILRRFPDIRGSWTGEKVFRLLKVVFPVFLGGILYNYLVSAPKLSIFRVLSEESQALFNILFMPVFIINILSQFVFRPMVAQMGIWWNAGDRAAFRKSVRRQVLLIAGLTAAIVLAGYLFGWKILGFIYAVDLSEYQELFAMLLIFGGVAALSTFFSVVLTIMRHQIVITAGYVAGLICCLLSMDSIIRRFGLSGAGDAYGRVMTIVLAVFLGAYLFFILRAEKGKNHE